MARVAVISLFLFVCWQTFDLSVQDREVLIRDRLVLVLCDQLHDYLETGNLPGPIKKMPEKYKQVKPGVSGKMDGFKVIPSSRRRRNAENPNDHPILDFLY
ncbi:hypothetical protein Ocin01_03165, partial [Orchesella cincta]